MLYNQLFLTRSQHGKQCHGHYHPSSMQRKIKSSRIIPHAPCHNETLLMLHLNCFSLHKNWISPLSSGSLHFRSTKEQSTTSGFKNKLLASLYSQSSGAGCFYIKTSKTSKTSKQASQTDRQRDRQTDARKHTHTHKIRTKVPRSCG